MALVNSTVCTHIPAWEGGGVARVLLLDVGQMATETKPSCRRS